MIMYYIVGIIVILDIALWDIVIACKVFRFRAFKECSVPLAIDIVCACINVMNFCDILGDFEGLPEMIVYVHKSIPKAAVLLIATIFFVGGWFEIYREYIFRKTKVTAASIIQSFNNMNCGLLYAFSDGSPILKNRKMLQISNTLFGKRIWNALEFWESVCSFDHNEEAVKIPNSPEISARFSDGSVWCFEKNDIYFRGKAAVEIIARDMTELFSKREELEKENEKLEKIQSELKVVYRNIAEIQQQEELLIYKMKIHDKLGNAIIAANNYLKDDELTSEERRGAINIWKATIGEIKKNAYHGEVVGEGSLEDVVNTARSLGAKYIMEGNFPTDNPLVAPALREAMYNSIRHAGANVVMARSKKSEEGYTIVISDNGKCDKESITENGGLATMRRKVERAGGKMKIEVNGKVELTLFFPKDIKTGIYAIKEELQGE